MSRVSSCPHDAEQISQDQLETLLEELPAGIPLLPPEDRGNFAKYKYPPRIYKPGEAWQHCARAMEAHDLNICKAYREEIDTLLVFAGLFSSVVTAFSVESYQWFKNDSDDALLILLSQIAQSTFPNITYPPRLPAADSGIHPTVRTRINAYWFLALSLSLSAALIAILCKQWIREFERHADLAPKEFVSVRQMKYDGLERWRVPDVIALLPILLQLSLGLFALGVLELLWQLHAAIAIAVSVPTSITIVFYGATTFLPLVQRSIYTHNPRSALWTQMSQCPYKSPQALMAFSLYDAAARLAAAALALQRRLYRRILPNAGGSRRSDTEHAQDGGVQPHCVLKSYSWNLIDLEFLEYLDDANAQRRGSVPGACFRGLAWLDRNMRRGEATEWIWECLWEEMASPPDEARVRCGLAHITGSDLAQNTDPRSLALLYLDRTTLPREVVAEVFIQNLSSTDYATATHFLSKESLFRDSQLVISLVRAVASYCHSHAYDRTLGPLLVELTRIVTSLPESQEPPGDGLRRCVLALFLTWLRAQSTASHDADVAEHAARALRYHLVSLPAGLRERPQGVRDLPLGVELAQLASVVASMSAGRETSRPLPDDLRQYFPDVEFYRSAGLIAVVRELLTISTHAGDPWLPPCTTFAAALPGPTDGNRRHMLSVSLARDGTDISGKSAHV